MAETSASPAARESRPGINHVALAVGDLVAAEEFYRGATGFPRVIQREEVLPAAVTGAGTASASSVVLAGPNGQLALTKFHGGVGRRDQPLAVNGPGITHLCYQGPSEGGLYTAFGDRGVSRVSRGDGVIDLNGSGVYYAYVRDPDGAMIEVEHTDRPRFSGPIWVGHVAMATPDLDRMLAFYGRIAGVEPFRRGEFGGLPALDDVAGVDGVRLRAAWLRTRNMVMEFWQYVHPATPKPAPARPLVTPGYYEIAFEVADLDRTHNDLVAQGMRFLTPPGPVGDELRAYGHDPDGNLVSLRQLPAASPISIDRLDEQFVW